MTLGVSLGVALNSGGVLAEHVTNKWDVRRGLEADNWTVIYSEEFGTDDWVQLTFALVADAYGCAGGCTSAFIQNFGYQSYNTIVQELGQKSPDLLNSFLSAMTKTDFGSLLASALKDGNVESRNLPGVRLELGSSAYNRKECEFGICVPLPNSHQPYIRVKFLAGSTPEPDPDNLSQVSTVPVFDAEFYLRQHTDLEIAFGDDYEAAKNHWLSHGIKEGRKSSFVFDVKYYLSQHADLQNAFGNDYEAAIKHYLKYGISEGRQGSVNFNPRFYLSNNPDLQNAYGANNYKGALDHYLKYGISEGRQGSANFDPRFYLSNNPDLQNAMGADNYKGALDHYLKYGRSEGRQGTP
jgi:hypothetical protein